jgi:dGTPase
MTVHATPQRYDSLLSSQRARQTDTSGRTLFEESESDRARVVFSSPFRRLQQKAQVYSLEDNAAVRSRLTHSLEVAQVGRLLSQKVLELTRPNQGALGLTGKEQVFQNLIETACLIHDVGNPPFGHFGESAISEWFRTHAQNLAFSALKTIDDLPPVEFPSFADFENFDGNCQGFRILTRLQWNKDEFGLNLTFSQLATYLKYVVPAKEIDQGVRIKKKPGFFESEQELVEKMWTALGMTQQTRFPLTYLMEAADDIAYCISDIEDGIEKSLTQERTFFDWLKLKLQASLKNADDELEAPCKRMIEKADVDLAAGVPMRAFTNFRASLTRELAEYAARRYVDSHTIILAGTADPLLVDSSVPVCGMLDALREFAVVHLYSSRAATNNELAGFSVITGLLDHHRSLLSCDRATFQLIREGKKKKAPNGKLIVVDQRLFKRLPQKYCRAYDFATRDLGDSQSDLASEWFHRAHLVVDYIAGMTDDFALETFQLLSGISVGSPD